jgi:hypothetical protein
MRALSGDAGHELDDTSRLHAANGLVAPRRAGCHVDMREMSIAT